jgi:general secretion pathway protein M
MRSLLDVSQLPTGRNGRLLAAGLLVVVLGLCWALIAGPLIGWYGEREQALEQRVSYADRMAAIAADLPLARREAASAREQAPPPNTILAGNSDPIAGASLESAIDSLAHDAGATLISTEALPAVQDGGFRRIGLHVTARASWTRLTQMLAAIERAEPRMSIGNLDIQAGPLGGPEQLLDMSFAVSAFRAGTAAPNAPADAGGDSAGADQ